MADTHTNVLVRMTLDLKAELLREAAVNDRKLTAEINQRLRESLDQERLKSTVRQDSQPAGKKSAVNEGMRELRNTELEEAILSVIRKMPVEKQLAFLTLIK